MNISPISDEDQIRREAAESSPPPRPTAEPNLAATKDSTQIAQPGAPVQPSAALRSRYRVDESANAEPSRVGPILVKVIAVIIIINTCYTMFSIYMMTRFFGFIPMLNLALFLYSIGLLAGVGLLFRNNIARLLTIAYMTLIITLSVISIVRIGHLPSTSSLVTTGLAIAMIALLNLASVRREFEN